MEGTLFSPSLEGMQHIKSPQGDMLTKPFLNVCKLILPVIDKFGPAMALVKIDIACNISKLEKKYQSDTTRYNFLYNMVKEEYECNSAKGSRSYTSRILWLTRSMDFIVELFRNLLAHQEWSMAKACTDSYGKTLKKFNGWIASLSFNVSMKLVPDRKKFMEAISLDGDVKADMESFCSTFPPFLEQNHKFLIKLGLDVTNKT